MNKISTAVLAGTDPHPASPNPRRPVSASSSKPRDHNATPPATGVKLQLLRERAQLRQSQQEQARVLVEMEQLQNSIAELEMSHKKDKIAGTKHLAADPQKGGMQ